MGRIVITFAIVALLHGVAAAQGGQPAGSGSGSGAGAGSGAEAGSTQKGEPRAERTLRTRQNVKVDVTISDQIGNGPVEKKAVSVIAAEESWGKIRTAATTRLGDGSVAPVSLNVDARPFLTGTGAIQLELVLEYNPLGNNREASQARPTALNQSLTVVLQHGKPMLVSQAADPIMDRKIVVEVVAAILK